MLNIKFIIALLFIINITRAQCLSSNPKNYHLKWTAFKTAKKIGVEGEFNSITFKNFKPKTEFNYLLKDISFEISTNSMSTNNESRDNNLKSHFFDFGTISAVIKKVEKDYILLSVLMNKKQKIVALKYRVEKSKISATGFIDILDFNLSNQLANLNKQCFSLHEGKTWSDVELSLNVELEACE